MIVNTCFAGKLAIWYTRCSWGWGMISSITFCTNSITASLTFAWTRNTWSLLQLQIFSTWCACCDIISKATWTWSWTTSAGIIGSNNESSPAFCTYSRSWTYFTISRTWYTWRTIEIFTRKTILATCSSSTTGFTWSITFWTTCSW